MITAFSLAFLVPLFTTRWHPAAESSIVGATILAAALAMRRAPRLAAAIVGGALAFGLRAPSPAPLPEVAPRTAQVTLDGIVSGASWTRDGRLHIPLSGGRVLITPIITGTPPLPGTRVRGEGRLEASGRVIRVTSTRSLHLGQPPPPWHPGALTERVRRDLRRRLGLGTSPCTASALRALVLGDSLEPDRKRRLARTGTLHFFAVSGLHLSLLAAMIVRLVGPRGRWVLPLLIAYAALTGLRAPVSRALLMVAGLIGARAHRRPFRPVPQLLLAATVVTCVDPAVVDSAGFLLSFSAYAGIVVLALPAIERRRGDPLRSLEFGLGSRGPRRERLIAMCLITAAAYAASAPATAILFHRLTPVALLGSLLLAPIVPVIVLCCAALLAWPGCPPVVFVAELCLKVLDVITIGLDGVPHGSFVVGHPHPIAIVGFIAGLGVAARVVTKGRRPERAVGATVLGTALLAIPTAPPSPGAILLNAGRGFSLLVDDGKAVTLVDAGPARARVADQLLALGVTRIDTLAITHEHEDHAGGRADVIANLAVGTEEQAPSSATVLWPRADAEPLGLNDRSVVILFEGRRHRLLVTGDLETRGLRLLLAATERRLDADVLVLPHHGARNDALADLVLRAAPDRCWLPARAGFPSETSMLTLLWLGAAAEPTWGRDQPPPRFRDLPPR